MNLRFALGALGALLLHGGLAVQNLVWAQTTAPLQPKIEVQQKLPDRLEKGSLATIEILVCNVGAVPVDSLTVLDTLPAEHEFVDATPAAENKQGKLAWVLGGLEPGRQHVLRVRLKVRPGGATELRNSVTTTYQMSVNNSSSKVIKHPELALAVTAPEMGQLGEPVSFVITVNNKGASAARNVQIRTRLPSTLTHPCGAILENDLGAIEAGETRTVPLLVTAARTGESVTRIGVSATDLEVVEKEIKLRTQEVRLGIAANGPTILYPTWPGTYEVTVTNEGSDAVAPVCPAVYLPTGLTFGQVSENGKYDAASHSIQWSLGSLRAGEKKTVVFSAVATQPGAQECKIVLLSASKQVRKQVLWSTRVMPTTNPTSD